MKRNNHYDFRIEYLHCKVIQCLKIVTAMKFYGIIIIICCSIYINEEEFFFLSTTIASLTTIE